MWFNCIVIFSIQVMMINSRSSYGCGQSGCFQFTPSWVQNEQSLRYVCGPSGCGYIPCGPYGCNYGSQRPCVTPECGGSYNPCNSYGVLLQRLSGVPCGNQGTTIPWEEQQIVGGHGQDCPRGFTWDNYRQRCVRVFG